MNDQCWTGVDAGGVCPRGGIGCPLPHDGSDPGPMPAAFSLHLPTCPVHHCYNAWGDAVSCLKCPRSLRLRRKLRMVSPNDWTMRWRQVRRAKREALKRWQEQQG